MGDYSAKEKQEELRKMKFKVLSLIFVMIFALPGVVFAMTRIEILPPISEAALMLLFGILLTSASFYGKKLYPEQRINQNRLSK